MDRELLVETIREDLMERPDVRDQMNFDVHNQMDHLKKSGLEFNLRTHEEMVCRLQVEWMTKFILDLIP